MCPYSVKVDMSKDSKRRRIILTANEALEIYGRMTVRALFYQLVVKGVVENTLKEYSRVVKVLTDARRNGIIDWRRISDHTTKYYGMNRWSSIEAFLEDMKDEFALMPEYGKIVEVWIEKDAMAWISEVTEGYNIPTICMVGYAKLTALEMLKARLVEDQKEAVIFLLTDYDPSGRNIAEKVMEELAVFGNDVVKVERIALTEEQVKKYNLPSVPAKKTDSRTREGDIQVELDALPPDVVRNIVKDVIEGVITPKELKAMKTKEQKIRERLEEIVEAEE